MRLHYYQLYYIFVFLLMLSSYIINSQIIGWIALVLTVGQIVRNINKPAELLILQLLYIFQYQFYISYLYMPTGMSFLTDIITIIILINYIYEILFLNRKTHKLEFSIMICLLCFVTLGFLGNILQGFSPIRYMWAVRNNARIFLFFIFSIHYLSPYLIRKSESLFTIAYFFNIIFIWIQYYYLGFKQDFLGGIFGNEIGTANTYLHILLLIFICISISKYITSNISIIKFLIYIISILLVAALSELKIVFIEIIIIYLISYLIIGFDIKRLARMLLIVVPSIVVFIIAIPILESVSPFFKGFLNVESLLSISTGSYTGKGDIGRLSAINYVRERMFNYDNSKTLIGIGLGNAELSQSNILTSPFYLAYGNTTHYNWFSFPFVMIETGLIGVMLYLFPYIYIFREMVFNNNKQYKTLISLQLSIMAFVLFIYNISLRIEIGYLFVFVLAFGTLNFHTKGENNES
ncbi:polymerase [Streptococcus suis]|uniref:polymerase n=1 Tax=Streptococcus suis TaxID=1307 RepID=UPI000CF38114|nr:polymerase [Streptococcus suis]